MSEFKVGDLVVLKRSESQLRVLKVQMVKDEFLRLLLVIQIITRLGMKVILDTQHKKKSQQAVA